MVTEVDGQGEACGVGDEVAAGQDGGFIALVAGQVKHLRRVRGDEVDSREFLHDLHSGPEEDAAARVQLVLRGQHIPVRGRLGAGFEADSGDDLAHLELDLALVVAVEAHAAQDAARLVHPAGLDQMAGGFRVEGAGEQDEEQEDDLQREGEAP